MLHNGGVALNAVTSTLGRCFWMFPWVYEVDQVYWSCVVP
jgi:hypothetical protein